MKFYLLTLGCPKNQVDAEFMSARLMEAGYTSSSAPQNADILIINTCSFIESARAEAVDAILDLLPYKKPHGKAEYLILTGCLPQMIGDEIFVALPEVDAVLGTAEYGRIVETIRALIAGEWPVNRSPQGVGGISHLRGVRMPASQQYAWLKISEGCSNHCTYCTIPAIRGPQISRPIDDICREALSLAAHGVQEIILIAQDTTRYGTDIYGKPVLDLLLQELDNKLPSDIWIRMMYFYADSITDNLIEVMAQSDRILKYIDLPIQHASDVILKRMGRLETSALIKEKISMLRSKLPGLILRTTVMVGFPGETEDDLNALINFMEEIRFDRLGCFIFSPEAGTPASRLSPRISSVTAQKRYDRVMLAQRRIELAKSQERIGTITDVIFSDYHEGDILYQGRSYGEAPDVDPVIWVASTVPDLDLNKRHPVRIVKADHYLLVGVTEYEHCE